MPAYNAFAFSAITDIQRRLKLDFRFASAKVASASRPKLKRATPDAHYHRIAAGAGIWAARLGEPRAQSTRRRRRYGRAMITPMQELASRRRRRRDDRHACRRPAILADQCRR